MPATVGRIEDRCGRCPQAQSADELPEEDDPDDEEPDDEEFEDEELEDEEFEDESPEDPPDDPAGTLEFEPDRLSVR